LALRAIDLFEQEPTRKLGLLAVEDTFDVSSSTARNLVCAGRRLRDDKSRESSAVSLVGAA
jgi:hypothetical protein